MNVQRITFGRSLILLVVGLLVLSTVLWGGKAQALPLDDAVASAGKIFLNSIVSDYAKATDKVYDTTLKSAQETINNLAEKLERASDPALSATQRQSLVKEINSAQEALADFAKSFNGFAEDTKEFDSELVTTVQKLLDAVKGDAHTQLSQTEDAFSQIANAISGLAQDADQVDADNLTALIGNFENNIKSLNQAISLGSKAVQALSLLAG